MCSVEDSRRALTLSRGQAVSSDPVTLWRIFDISTGIVNDLERNAYNDIELNKKARAGRGNLSPD
jgi:hypothetical protein